MNILENNFEIEDLGVQELEVYDIEVENNHNFFGNDILIHNSGYYTIAPIMNEIIKNNPNKSINDYVDIANKFELKFIDPVIQKSVDIATTHLNARRPEVIGAKREIIADTCIYLQKKRYLARVRDSEGTRYPESEPHMKYMGVELARSSTTDWVKKHLSESLNILFDKSENDLKLWINNLRKDFTKLPIADISNYCSISSVELKQGGTHYVAKGAYYYNKYIIKNNLQAEYTLLQAGAKARVIFLKPLNPLNELITNTERETNKVTSVDRLVYIDPRFAESLRQFIDFDKTFNDFFIQPLQNMTTALGYDLSKPIVDNVLEDW